MRLKQYAIRCATQRSTASDSARSPVWNGSLRGPADQLRQVLLGVQPVGLIDRQQSLVFDLLIVAVPVTTVAVARIAPFFDVHQRHFQRQTPMRKDAGKMN